MYTDLSTYLQLNFKKIGFLIVVATFLLPSVSYATDISFEAVTTEGHVYWDSTVMNTPCGNGQGCRFYFIYPDLTSDASPVDYLNSGNFSTALPNYNSYGRNYLDLEEIALSETQTGEYCVGIQFAYLGDNIPYYKACATRTATSTWTAFGVSPEDTSTRIITVDPYDGETLASSTTFTLGGTGYISEDDWVDGAYVSLRDQMTNSEYGNQTAFALNAWQYLYSYTITAWNLTAFGSFDFSTTTIDYSASKWIGRHTMVVEIRSPSSSWFSWLPDSIYKPADKVLFSTTTSFLVATSSIGDIQADTIGVATQEFADAVYDGENCRMTSFDLGLCIKDLFIPDSRLVADAFGDFYNDAFKVLPFGYITRTLEIIALTDSTIPPPLVYSFGSSSPQILQDITADDPITFQIFNRFDTLESIKSDQGSNKNLWDIVMPYFQTVVALAVFLVMIEDLLGIRIAMDASQSTSEEVSVDSKGVVSTATDQTKNSAVSVNFQGVTSTRDRHRTVSTIQKTYHNADGSVGGYSKSGKVVYKRNRRRT